MGIEVYRGSLDAQAESTKTMSEKQISSYEELGKALQQVQDSAEDLSGKAYESFRTFAASVIVPLQESGKLLSEMTRDNVKKLPTDYRSEVADEDLQEEKLVEDIEKYSQLISENRSQIDSIAAKSKPSPGDFQRLQNYQKIGQNYEEVKRKLEEKLEKLRNFNASSPAIFDDIQALAASIDTGVGQLSSSWDVSSGTFVTPQDLSWTKLSAEIKETKEFAKKHDIKKPEEMSYREFRTYIKGLKSQVEQLKKEDGWDDAAVENFISQVKSGTKNLKKADELTQKRDQLYSETKEVGSEVYTGMYAASNYSSKEKLELVLNHLGAEVDVEGEYDYKVKDSQGNVVKTVKKEYGFMYLNSKTHRLSSQLHPTSDFYAYFREDVKKTFNNDEAGLNKLFDGEKEGAANNLGAKIHYFRSYIDKQNIEYIRQNYEGETDYEKLQAYGEDKGIEFDYTTGASLHNRSQDKFKYGNHMKVLPPKQDTSGKSVPNNARMSEFIVDVDTGSFVSEWDALENHKLANGKYDMDPSHYTKEELGEIANTESFNYGLSRGDNKDVPLGDTTHDRLDVKHPDDHKLRLYTNERQFDSGSESKWKADKEKYVDIVKKGGKDDYEAWQKNTQGMSEDEKVEEYRKYQNYVNKFGNNRSYSDYSHSKQYNKDH